MATDYSTINSATIQPNPALVVPPVPPADTSHIGVTQGVADTIANDLTNLTAKTDQAQGAVTDSGKGITDIMSQLTGKTADTQIANEVAGVNTATADVNKYQTSLADLNSQASQLNREAQAIPIQVQNQAVGTGATDRGIAPITSARLRDNALKALSIGQQADIASAALTGSNIRLQAAKDKAIQMVDLKYKPMEEQLAIKTKQYELNKDALTAIDKKRAESLGIALDKEKQDIADKKANEKAISDMIINASSANAPSATLEAAKKATSPAQAAMILKQYAGDYYKTELLKKQIETEKLQQAKIGQEISKNKTDAVTAMVSSPVVQAYIARVQANPKEMTNVPKQYKDAVVLGLSGAGATTNVNATAIQGLQDKVSNIQGLIDNTSLSDAVGPNALARTSFTTAFTGARQNFVGGVKQLTSKETLDTLTNLKAAGGTLGALSDQERVMLQNAATKIGNWEIKDAQGNGTGFYNVDEQSFKDELGTLKTLAERALVKAGGSVPVADNPFQQAMTGNSNSTPIQGTKIINKVGNDGSIEFVIPK